ncbi:hypothetical protein Rt10032_c16g5744 [Rhodotorula toruloides]|uniref:Uncharacterized protein n=1 Tax=Rhodotorula toruloides TaxID=5286 RepID=A0A511KN06_RHOTO|nr:hypothetical protein Rt10032_c16g5744 [Rhodotorula toruloides]
MNLRTSTTDLGEHKAQLAGHDSELAEYNSQLVEHSSQLAIVTSSIADTFASYRREAAGSYSQAFLPSLHLLLAEPPASFQKGIDKLEAPSPQVTNRNLRRIVGMMEGIRLTAHGQTCLGWEQPAVAAEAL